MLVNQAHHHKDRAVALPPTVKSIIYILSHQLKAHHLHKDLSSTLNQTNSKIVISIDLKVKVLVENNLIHLPKLKENQVLKALVNHNQK